MQIVQMEGVPDVLARILASRGVAPEAVRAYLEPRIRELMPDPSRLTDMDKAADRLARAVLSRETIGIFGDYDVDGACSSALLGEFLRFHDTPYHIHIPDRIIEGYGPNIAAIDSLMERGVTLLITVDCGTASHEAFAHARRLGLDVVVLDHHQAPVLLPETVALVNPNRQDDLSGLGYLCAAGVVFMTLVAASRVLREQNRSGPVLLDLLDLVALATVADVVPLVALNRAFVTQGLAVMKRRERPGLRSLFDVARLDGPPSPYHLGFMVGPRINAGGRIGDAALGARLLLADDDEQARRAAETLESLNRDRQVIEAAALEDGQAQADRQVLENPDCAVLLVGSADWHPGVVGLVAARLKERFRRPAFAIAWGADGSGTGSGRSVPGVDLGAAVRGAVEAGLLVKGGGHAMAAGLTVMQSAVKDLSVWLQDRLAAQAAIFRRDAALRIDGLITASAATAPLVHLLEKAGPYGSASPEPVFALPNHVLVDATIVSAQEHVRVRLKAGDGVILNGIAFRAGSQPLGQALRRAVGHAVHVTGTLGIDRWGGAEKPQLRVIDMVEAARRG